MKNNIKQFNNGISLVEVIVVVAVIAIMILAASPVMKTMENAFTSSVSTETMISAALTSARATAAKNQKYAGVRFQQDKDGDQYMIPIVYDDVIGEGVTGSVGLRVVKGKKPVKLQDKIIVLDLKLNNDNDIGLNPSDSDIDESSHFSILFSASGNLVIHEHRVASDNDEDNVYNNSIDSTDYLFEEDGSTQTENSRNYFVICNKEELDQATNKWTDYLEDLKVVHINAYTGSIINSGN